MAPDPDAPETPTGTPARVATTPDGLPFPQPYPKMLYHRQAGQRVVAHAEEQAAVMATDPGWSEVPLGPGP
jgi:hypothetical protein